MAQKRIVEVFTAGCSICDDVVEQVESKACECCEVKVRNTRDEDVAGRARSLRIARVPAVVIDGKVVNCCSGRIDTNTLKSAGLGRAAV